MSDKKRKDEGYTPSPKKGNQSQEPSSPKPDKDDVSGGYQPTRNEGDNTRNKPPPKKL